MLVLVAHEECVCRRDYFHNARDDSGIRDFINGVISQIAVDPRQHVSSKTCTQIADK